MKGCLRRCQYHRGATVPPQSLSSAASPSAQPRKGGGATLVDPVVSSWVPTWTAREVDASPHARRTLAQLSALPRPGVSAKMSLLERNKALLRVAQARKLLRRLPSSPSTPVAQPQTAARLKDEVGKKINSEQPASELDLRRISSPDGSTAVIDVSQGTGAKPSAKMPKGVSSGVQRTSMPRQLSNGVLLPALPPPAGAPRGSKPVAVRVPRYDSWNVDIRRFLFYLRRDQYTAIDDVVQKFATLQGLRPPTETPRQPDGAQDSWDDTDPSPSVESEPDSSFQAYVEKRAAIETSVLTAAMDPMSPIVVAPDANSGKMAVKLVLPPQFTELPLRNVPLADVAAELAQRHERNPRRKQLAGPLAKQTMSVLQRHRAMLLDPGSPLVHPAILRQHLHDAIAPGEFVSVEELRRRTGNAFDFGFGHPRLQLLDSAYFVSFEVYGVFMVARRGTPLPDYVERIYAEVTEAEVIDAVLQVYDRWARRLNGDAPFKECRALVDVQQRELHRCLQRTASSGFCGLSKLSAEETVDPQCSAPAGRPAPHPAATGSPKQRNPLPYVPLAKIWTNVQRNHAGAAHYVSSRGGLLKFIESHRLFFDVDDVIKPGRTSDDCTIKVPSVRRQL